MSIKAITKVWETSKQSGSALLMLLAIADYAKDDGSGAWPSLNTLAKKTRMGRRNAIKLIQKLEESGELSVRRKQGPHGTNFYDLNFHPPVNPSSPLEKQASEPQDTTLVNPSSPPLVNPSSPNTLIETSLNRHLDASPTEKTYTPSQIMFGHIAKICQYDLELLTKKQRGQLNKESKRLIDANIQPEQIKEFDVWWYATDWRGKKGQPPQPAQIREMWGQFKKSKNGQQPEKEREKILNPETGVWEGGYFDR